ncbi:MAG: class I SAM-dependent methyltransferase [Anaerolineae bacterium]
MTWRILAAAVVVALLLYWQLIIAEGAYLGQKVVTLLYDRVAHKYNSIKAFDAQDERDFLGAPLIQALGNSFTEIVLDVATGTGRLPAAILQQPHFRGTVIGVDHSARMLAQAQKIGLSLTLVQADAMRLPFACNAVQGVTCLEALEFLPDPQGGLRELVRVLSPNGVLLTTRRTGWETILMPGKTWPEDKLRAILNQLPLAEISIIPWQDIYQQVWARKQQVANNP